MAVQTQPQTSAQHAARLELCRRHYLDFVQYTWPGYHVAPVHTFLANRLEQFEADGRAKKSPRLMVFMPPRVGKSELISRRYPGWFLGRNPDATLGIVSYGAELAEELSAYARRVVMTDEYRDVFGNTYQPDPGSTVEIDKQSRAVGNWHVANRRGGLRAVGAGGALTGRGFDAAILDDVIKGREEADSELERDKLWKWWQGTLRTRIEPGGGVLLVMTRWHHDDLAGRLLDQMPDRWDVINLPALADEGDILGRQPGEALDPLRYDEEAYAAIREEISEREWTAQYQGRPSPDKGDVFERDWFTIEPLPPGGRDLPVVQYWDTAHGKRNPKRKGDRSVCATWRAQPACFRIVHLYVGRPGYHELKPLAIQLAQFANQNFGRLQCVVIEDHSSGISLIQDLKNETRLNVRSWNTRNESKLERAKAVSPTVQAGRAILSIPRQQAEAFINEHCLFPNSKYDDIVDTTSMALSHLAIWRRPERSRIVVRDF